MQTTLAQRIAEIAAELNITLEEIAVAAGVSRAAVSKWRLGTTKNLRMEHLYAIEDRYGYCARWIATGKGPKRKPDTADCVDLSGLDGVSRAAILSTVAAFKIRVFHPM